MSTVPDSKHATGGTAVSATSGMWKSNFPKGQDPRQASNGKGGAK